MQGLPPFGIIVPGQPPQFNFSQLSSVQWTITLETCPSSFLFFLTMSEPLPAGYGLSIYAASAVDSGDCVNRSSSAGDGFTFLGAVLNAKPSALFEVPASLLPSTDNQQTAPHAPAFTIGVSLETEDGIRNLLDSGGIDKGNFHPLNTPPPQQQYGAVYKSNNATRYALGEKVLDDFCMFIASFVKSVSAASLPSVLSDVLNSSQSASPSGQAVVEYVVMPVSFVDSWRQRLERKMKANGGAF